LSFEGGATAKHSEFLGSLVHAVN
jgi:hypothetical protein